MNTTDNAFIKAYAEELAVALGRPAKQVDRRKIRPDAASPAGPPTTPPVSLSGLYATPAVEQAAASREPVTDVPQHVEFPVGQIELPVEQVEVPLGYVEVPAAQVEAPVEVPVERPEKPVEHVATPVAGLTTVEVAPPAAYPSRPIRQPAATLDQPAETMAPSEQSVDALDGQVNDAATRRRLDPAASTAPPQWHATFTEVVATDTELVAAETTASRDEIAATPQKVGVQLHSDAGAVPTPPTTRRDTFRPQWEVDGFQWPMAVDRLVEEYTGWLGDVLDRLMLQAEQGSKVTAITGYSRGEGRTTLALALARLAARRGVSVVLVDGDLENPQVASQLGMSFDAGWNQRGSDRATLAEVAVQSIEDNLTVLPLHSGIPTRDDADGDLAAAAINSLCADHDLLIVDTGPMFTATRHWFDRQADRAVDSALVVRDLRTVTDEQLTDVVERLTSRGIPIVGIAENFKSESADPSAAPGKLAS